MRARRRALGAAGCLLALAACGAPKAPTSERDQASVQGALPSGPLAATAEGPGDAVVATVAGLPVYASCVEHQAAAAAAKVPAGAGATAAQLRQQALEECLGFELLAQEAAARRLAAEPEVGEAHKRAAVSRFIEQEIDEKVRSAFQLPPAFTARVVEKNRWRLERVEYRSSMFVRFGVAETEPAGGPADAAARAAAQRLADALREERGLYPDHVLAAAERVAQGQRFENANVGLMDAPRLAPPYADALFALPEIGRITAPVRSQWGWDVILFTGDLPPRKINAAQLADELFPDLRLAYFTAWSKSVGKAVPVEVNPAAAELLSRATAEEEAVPGASPAPAASPGQARP